MRRAPLKNQKQENLLIQEELQRWHYPSLVLFHLSNDLLNGSFRQTRHQYYHENVLIPLNVSVNVPNSLYLYVNNLFALYSLIVFAGIFAIASFGTFITWIPLWFLLGLFLTPFIYQLFVKPEIIIESSPFTLIVAGLLVGFGTRLGSGCTSGHGICGISRLSLRSIIATVTFMLAGMITVYLVRHVIGVHS